MIGAAAAIATTLSVLLCAVCFVLLLAVVAAEVAFSVDNGLVAVSAIGKCVGHALNSSLVRVPNVLMQLTLHSDAVQLVVDYVVD